jgi:predicted DNA-binding transcriptional regulator YafY
MSSRIGSVSPNDNKFPYMTSHVIIGELFLSPCIYPPLTFADIMRADRLLSALLLLQSRGRMSGRDLAQRLEVSQRTVHRDMEALSAAGVPVFALRGAQGGWQLDENWRTQVPGLDEVELQALLMAQPRTLGDPKLAAAAERALGKLTASLPAALREQAAAIRQRVHVDTTAWRGSTENLAMLPIVQEGVSRDRKLEILYKKSGEEAARRPVDPLGLVAKGSSWYLVAQTSRGLRTFRVSRIQEARLLDAPCKRPAGFDLAAHWKSSASEYQKSWRRYETILLLDASAAEELKVWRISSPIAGFEKADAQGRTRLCVRFESANEAKFVVLGFGARVQVIEPMDLREFIASEIRLMTQRLEI